MDTPYTAAFYEMLQHGSAESARHVLPEVSKVFNVSSVIDVGCGNGTWLREFNRLGIESYLGLDGDYIDQKQLLIPADRFRATDLQLPFDFGKFDLACSLEVGEHLPESAADDFVASLTKAASIVLFSAAIPYQGGNHHINEQWQSWWATKFAARGYLALDFIRPIVRYNQKIEAWYRQNILVYCTPEARPKHIAPVLELRHLDLVLPEYYEVVLERETTRLPGGRRALRGLQHVVRQRLGL